MSKNPYTCTQCSGTGVVYGGSGPVKNRPRYRCPRCCGYGYMDNPDNEAAAASCGCMVVVGIILAILWLLSKL